MDRVLNKLKAEPVRVRLYGLLLLVAGYLVSRGYISPTDEAFIASVAVLALGVETARDRVSPAAKHVPRHRK